MNFGSKLAISVIGGLLVATTLVGTVIALPHMLGRTSIEPGRVSSSQAFSRAADRPSTEEMQSFMDQYRTADGRIDVDRVHANVVTGNVTPLCLDGTTQSGTTRPGAMRRGGSSTSGSFGPGMMGR